MSTTVSTCKGCGAQVVFSAGEDTVICEYCGSLNTKPEKTANYGDTNAENLIRQAYILMEDGNFKQAILNLQAALNLEPENATAYIGLLMAETGAKTEADLINSSYPLANFINFNNALRFADPEQKEMLENCAKQVEERINLHAEKDKSSVWKVVVGLISAILVVVVNIAVNNMPRRPGARRLWSSRNRQQPELLKQIPRLLQLPGLPVFYITNQVHLKGRLES